jgi:hypothetical protein
MTEENGQRTRYDETEFNPNIWLKAKAEREAVTAKRLLAMAPQNDPFNFGTPADWEKARWFKEQNDRFGQVGLHLRRLHYRISNLGEGLVPLWDGKPYENNKECWGKLDIAFTAARILGLVDPADFTERRVKTPRVDSMRGNVCQYPSFR